MNTIALLTDFGLKDNFVGVMKGVCLCINPRAALIDITHAIRPQGIKEAGFLLAQSFRFFPKGCVFLVVVDPGVGSARKAIAIKTKNYYFVGPDNGVLSAAAGLDGIKRTVSLSNRKYFLKDISRTFHGRDIFAPVAGHLSKGLAIERLGKAQAKIKEVKMPRVKIEKGRLQGEVVYIDRFGNMVTNITKKQLQGFTKKRKFRAIIRSKRIEKMYSFYEQAGSKELFLCEGGFGLLEVSLRQRSAAAFLRAKAGDKIIVT